MKRISHRFREILFPLLPIRSRLIGGVRDGGPPSGVFSEADCIRAGIVDGEIWRNGLAPSEIPVNSELHAAALDQDGFEDWETMWSKRENVRLVGPSLAHVDFKGRVCREALYGPHFKTDPVWLRRGKSPLRSISGNTTSIVSRWNVGSNFFHHFLDGLSRLTYLDQFPDDCAILVPKNPKPFAIRSYELLGISDRLIETGSEDWNIESYWFAAPTMLSGCPDPLGVHWLRKQFLPSRRPLPTRKIYLERKARTRSLVNHEEVRRIFQKRDWEIIDPGDLGLDEQIAIFSEASAVVGAHGAALTNLLWAPPTTRILELMPSGRRNGCYAGIAHVIGQDHKAVVCKSDRQGTMRVDTRVLVPLVSEMGA